MTTITDEELARELRAFVMPIDASVRAWEDLPVLARHRLIEATRTARRLLAPTYTDEDVENLIQSIEYGLKHTPHGIHGSAVIRQRLDEIKPTPTPEQLRMERGKAACVAAYSGATWEELPDSIQEEWCRIADVVLARQAEQDGEAET